MNQEVIQKMVAMEDEVVPTLFKPVQFSILKKLDSGKRLNENEKRYLRGKIKSKLNLLQRIMFKKSLQTDSCAGFLNSLGSYYITGLEALKHNGFGWYFDTKLIEVINTKIQGKLKIDNKTLRLIRVRSMRSATFSIDKKTGLKYATNEQIIKDTRTTRNEYAKTVWKQMAKRYEKIFVKNAAKYLSHQLTKTIDYRKYGV